MAEDKRKILYGQLTKDGYDLGDYDSFSVSLDKEENRKNLYEAITKDGYDVGDYNTFNGKISAVQPIENRGTPIVPWQQPRNYVEQSPALGVSPTQDFTDAAVAANNKILNDNIAEPVRDDKGRPYYPIKPEAVVKDEIRKEYQVEPVESQIDKAIAANEESIRRIKQEKNQAYDRNAEERPLLHALGGFARQYEGRVPDVNPSDDKEILRNLYAERNKLEEAKRAINASRTDGVLSNIVEGAGNAIKSVGFVDFGMSEMSDNSQLLNIKNKLDHKQPLTEDEQKLLNAAALEQDVTSAHRDRISPWYRAGQTIADMLPFMAEMALNPAAVLGKAAQKAVVNRMAGAVGNSLAKKILPKLARVAGDVAGASVMTATTGAMRTTADAERRMLGDVDASIKDGRIVGEGFSNGLNEPAAFGKAFGANTIENWTEMLGDYFSPALKGIGRVSGEGLRKMGIGKVVDFISDVNSTPFAKNVDDFLERTKWNGPIGEIAEEEAGIIANSYITGDNKLSDLTDPEQQLDIVLGVGLFGGFVSGLKTVAYRSPSKRAERDLRKSGDNASKQFSNWEELRVGIDKTDDSDLPSLLDKIINSDEVGGDYQKKAAIIDYAYSLQKWRGVNAAKLKQSVENPETAQDLMESDDEGESAGQATVPEVVDKVNVYRDYKRAERKVNSLIPAGIIPQLDGVMDVKRFAYENNLNDNQAMAISDYLTAKQPYSQYEEQTNLRRERVKIEARERAVEDVKSISNPDTGLVSQVKRKFAEAPVYLVGGRLSFGEDGLLDKFNSTPEVFYVDESGDRKMANPEDFDGVLNETEISDMIAQAEMDAENDFEASEKESLRTPDIPVPARGEVVTINGSRYLIEGNNADSPNESVMAIKLNDEGEIDIDNGDERPISIDEYYSLKEAELWGDQSLEKQGAEKTEEGKESPEHSIIMSQNNRLNKSSSVGRESNVSKDGELGETPEQKLQKVIESLPKNKNGKIDYKALTPQQQYEYTRITEDEQTAANDLRDEISAKEKELEKMNEQLSKVTGGKKAEVRDAIRDRKASLNELNEFFKQVVPSSSELTDVSVEENKSISEDLHTDEEYISWIADNSDDSNEILAAYSAAKELASHEQTLKPWQRELIGRKIRPDSFKRFGDRNHITGGLARAWLRKDGEEIDTLAQELSTFGGEVTEQDVIDFILDNPSNHVSQMSGSMRVLSSKFSDIATKEMGIPVSGPESNTGKLYIRLKEANQRLTDLSEQQRADIQGALSADMKAADEKRTDMYYDSLDAYAWRYDQFRNEFNEESADEAIIQETEASVPELYHGGFTGDELDEIYSQLDYNNGTERQAENSGEDQSPLSGEEIEREQESGSSVIVRAENSESERKDRVVEAVGTERIEAQTERNGAEISVDSNILFSAPKLNQNESVIDYADRIVEAQKIFEEEQKTDTHPTNAQKDAGNYKKGHIKLDGRDITIENPKGSERSGVDANGNPWSVTMNNTYGYIRGTEGVDGDHIDVFLSNDPSRGNVFVVDQVNEDGSFDEHKVMYGFSSVNEAKEAYLANYSPGWKGLGGITEISKEVFGQWVDSSRRKTKPFAEYKSVNGNKSNRLVTDERYAELLERMRKKLCGQMNIGVDPEILAIGTEMAVHHIENGARKFSEYAKAMISDLGDVIRPYLKSFYNGVRDYPGLEDMADAFTPYDEVRVFDVSNFDKPDSGISDVAETVAKEQEIAKQVEAIKKNRPSAKKSGESSLSLFDNELFDQPEQSEHGKNSNRRTVSTGQRKAEGQNERVGVGKRDGKSKNREEYGSERGSEEADSRLGETQREEVEGVQGRRMDRSRSGYIRPDEGRSGSLSDVPATESRRDVELSEKKNLRNNRNGRGKDYAPASPKARFDANIAAVRLMRELTEHAGTPTPAEMQVLRRYSGWGGLGTFFNNEHTAEGRMLREFLTEEEYEAAAMSLNSAYYTPAAVTDSLWDAAEKLGFKGGVILEGSAGIGNILGAMPESISERSEIEAVEIDSVSGAILKLLYPDAKVHVQGFQDTNIKNGSVDLAITNVPFVTGLHVYDKVDKDLSRKFKNIHDFCIAKNIRKLREGGIGIFITSNGTLDKSRTLREWIIGQGKADVVGAFRLNNETFGGTNATSDIIVVQKRVGNLPSAHAIDVLNTSVVRTGEYKTGEAHWDKKLGQYVKETKPVVMEYNSYFVQNPEKMAGEMSFAYEKGDTFRPGSMGLYPVKGQNQQEMLQQWVEGMFPIVGERNVLEKTTQRMDTNEKEGSLLLNKDGELCVSQRGEAVPVGVNKNKVKGYEKSECLKDYNAIKTALDEVLRYQVANEDDSQLRPLLKKLNRAYDNFTGKYGWLNRNTSISFLKNDVDFPSISALEDYRETKGIGGEKSVNVIKTNVFNGRVIGYKAEPTPTTVKDGVIASVYKFGSIDLGYIADKLGQTQEQVKNDILNERIGFVNPTTGVVEVRYEYLSGNVREKLDLAKANNADGEYGINIEELEKVIPMDIPAHLIEFSLGSSWVDPLLYQQFLSDEFGVTDCNVEHVEGAWVMRLNGGRNVEKNRQAGVYSEIFGVTIYGDELVAAALNNRAFAVKRIIKNSDGSTETVADKDATQACTTRIAEIKDSFKDWARGKMHGDEVLAEKMMRVYNDKFNAIVPKSIDDMFLPERFGGAAELVALYPHQKRSVIRGTTEPLMLAHEVGTGKTFTLISTAMEMRRIGTAKKPMIVVQNATVGQFVSEAKKLYPNASILTLSERDRTPEGRRAFYGKIKYSDWDMIVVPQSTFEMIPDSPERQMTFIRERIEDKMHALEAMREAGADVQVIKGMEKELDELEIEFASVASGESEGRKDAKGRAKAADNASVKAREQLDRRTDDVQYFDEMGVDAILVDEAHEYKRLGFSTMMTRGVKGIDPAGSKKAAGVYLKTRVVLEQNGWKNVMFATGTPISNTAAELWTFMKYLMPKEVMMANEIYYFDDFVRNFGNISQSLEFTTSGKFKENTRFAAYINKPELVRLWASVSDTVLTKEVNYVNDKVPEMENGKAQDIFLPQSDGLIDIMRAVRKRLDEFENMSGKEKRANSSIPLTMYGIAKRAAIDTRLVDKNSVDDPNSKTNRVVEETLRSLRDTDSYKGTVAIFCDNQRRWDGKVVGFDLFDDMKRKLVEKGVPQEQIVVMKSGMGISQKEKIFADVNAGNVRVIIGNTQTLGTGVNIQERLHTLVHMDAPDRPMDYTQRNGRILRQGNLHKPWSKPVRILRFGVDDSLDVTSYQRLKTKAGFIDSIMDGKASLANNQENRTLEEEEEGLFDNPVAILSGSQYALLKNQAEREYRKYVNKKMQYKADQIYIANRLRRNEGQIKANQELIEDRREHVGRIERLFPDGAVHEVKIAGKVCRGDAEIDSALRELVNKPIGEKVEAARKNTNYREEQVSVKLSLDGVPVDACVRISRESVYDNKVKSFRVVMHRDVSYSCEVLGLKDIPVSGGYVRNALDDLQENVVSGRDARESMDALVNANARMVEESGLMGERNGKPFEYEKELNAAKEKVEEYTVLMRKEMEEKEAKYADRGNATEVELAELEEEDLRFRELEEEVNAQFNEELKNFTEENADKIHLNLGMPSAALIAGGVEDKPIKLYGSKLLAKMKKHGFAISELYDLPLSVASPIAVFNNIGRKGNRSVLTELKTENGNFLVTIDLGKGEDADFDIVSSVFGKSDSSVANWINKGYATYIDKEKALNYLHLSAPIAEASNSSELSSVTKIIESFENPIVREGENDTYAGEPDALGNYSPLNGARKRKEAALEEGRAEEKGGLPLTQNNVANEIYKMSGEYLRALYRNGQLGRVLVGEYAEINKDKALQEYNHARPLLVSYKKALQGMKSRATDAARAVLDDQIRSVDYALWYYKELSEGKDVWRTESSPRFRFANMEQLLQQGSEFFEKENIANVAEELAEKLHVPIRIVRDVNEITDNSRVSEKKKRRASGWYDTKTGEVVVVLPNAISVADVQATVLHEVVAHKGLRDMLGKEAFDELCGKVFDALPENTRSGLLEKYKNRLAAGDEYMASIAEKGVAPSLWKKIKGFVRDAFRKMGVDLAVRDNDIKYLLWKSKNRLMKSDNGMDLVNKVAADENMKEKLGVGEYKQMKSEIENISSKYGNKEYRIFDKDVTIVDLEELLPYLEENDTLQDVANYLNTPETLAVYVHGIDKIYIFASKMSGFDRKGIEKVFFHENIHASLNDIYGDSGRRTIANLFYDKAGKNLDKYKNRAKIVYNEGSVKEEFFTWRLHEAMSSGDFSEFASVFDEYGMSGIDRILKNIGYDREEERNERDGRGRVLGGIHEERSSGEGISRQSNDQASGRTEEGTESKGTRDESGAGEEVIRFRDETESHPFSVAQTIYNESVKDSFRNNFSEGWFDFLRSVQKLQEAIEKATGKTIQGFENVYQRSIQLSSLNRIEFTMLQDKMMDPLSEDIARMIRGKEFRGHKMTYDDVDIYLNCKHGLERNEEFARRDAKNDDGVEDAEAYLKNRERDYSGLTGIFDPEKTGLSNSELEAEAGKYIAEFEGIYDAESINKLWDSVGSLTGYALDKSYKCGLIGKKEYEETKDTFKFYVPLRGFSETTSGDIYDYISRYGNENAPQKVLKNAWGRSSRADNILATMMNMAHGSVIQGNKNLVKQSLMTMAMNHRTPLLSISKQWYERRADGLDYPLYPIVSDMMSAEEQRKAIESFEDEMKSKHDAGEVFEKKDGLKLQFKVAEKWEADNHCVRVVRGGKEYLVWVNGNPKVAQSLNGDLNLDSELVDYEKFIAGANRFIARMQTAYSPEFIVRNLKRDILFSNVVAYIKEGGKYWAGFNRNLKDNLAFISVKGKRKGTYAGIYSLYTKHKNDALDMGILRERYFKEFIENGGETGYSLLYTVDDYKERIDKIVKQANTGYGKVGKGIESIGAGIEFANRGVENACRFAAYMTSREQGRGVLQSVMDAKEISVNFNRKGSGALGNRFARMAYTYMNTTIQATYQLLKLFGKYPKRSLGVFGSVAALGFLNSLATRVLLSAFGSDDDDDKYDRISAWKRRNNICIFAGDGFVTWPLSPELRVFYGIGEICSSIMTGDMNHENALFAIMGQLQQMSPWNFVSENNIGGVDFLKTTAKSAVPTGVSFLTDAYLANENFLGRKITNAESWNEKDPEWKRCTKGTNTWFIDASRWLNEATGGNDYKRGWLDNASSGAFNPGAVEYLLTSYLGGLGTFATKLSKVGMALGGDEDMKEFRNIPIASVLYTSVDNDYSRRKIINDAYRYYKNEFEITDNQLKGFNKDWNSGNEERAAQAIDNLHNGDDYKRWEILKEYLPAIKKLEKELYDAQNSDDKIERDRLAEKVYLLKQEAVGKVRKSAR